jgi:hypothetical protein
MIIGDRESCSVIRGYAPKTSSVGTSLFRPVVLLTAFTAIYKIVSLLSFLPCNSLLKILYKRYSGAWYLSTLLMLL